MLIVTACDINYYGYAKRLVKSIRHKSPKCKILLKLIDFHNNELIGDDIQIIEETTGLSGIPNMIVGGMGNRHLLRTIDDGVNKSIGIDDVKHSKWLVSKRQCYSSNTRFRSILHSFDLDENVIYLDADTIVNRELAELESLLDCDVACRRMVDERYPDGIAWQCSFIYAKSTSINFIESTMQSTEKNMFFWDSDQYEFEKNYQIHKDHIRFNIISSDIEYGAGMRDTNFIYNPSSYVFAGSGTNKTSNLDFIKMLKLYE
jgi:lipopolysaccharide biosynthesis glycosyltransferase